MLHHAAKVAQDQSNAEGVSEVMLAVQVNLLRQRVLLSLDVKKKIKLTIESAS
jgi:hypothetical protein